MAIQEQKIFIQKCSQYKKLQYINCFQNKFDAKEVFWIDKNSPCEND